LGDPLEPYKFYFKILLLLRFFTEWTRETLEDFQKIDNIFNVSELRLTPTEMKCLRDNWKEVLLHFKDAYTPIKKRLDDKTEEVKSLGDDFVSAISALEATKSTTLGRFAMLFTVMTILYLPPGFTSVCQSSIRIYFLSLDPREEVV